MKVTNNETLLPIARLRQFVSLDEGTGTLVWRARNADSFNSSPTRTAEHRSAHWNSFRAGEPALNCLTSAGYLSGRIEDRFYFAHRVVIALSTGAWPSEMTDHINGVRTDNRPNNLRDVPHLENQKNKCRPSINTSGVIGVHWHSQHGKWRSSIKVNGKSCHLGLFESIDEAAKARKQAEENLGFHKNHGRN